MKNFKVFSEKGFSLTFDNGITISVKFGSCNYCERKDTTPKFSNFDYKHESNSAEIAMWDKNDVWFNFGYDNVKGYVSTNEVARWIEKASKAKSIKTIRK